MLDEVEPLEKAHSQQDRVVVHLRINAHDHIVQYDIAQARALYGLWRDVSIRGMGDACRTRRTVSRVAQSMLAGNCSLMKKPGVRELLQGQEARSTLYGWRALY